MLAFVVLIAILVPAEPLLLDHSWSEAMHHLEDAALLTMSRSSSTGSGGGSAVPSRWGLLAQSDVATGRRCTEP